VSDRGTDRSENPSESWLRVELHQGDRSCTLVLRGTLSHTSITALEAQMDQLGCLPCHEVVVDVRGLTALDAVGANVLLGLYYYVDARGGHLRIVGAAGPIATTLRQYAIEYAEAEDSLTNTIDDQPAEVPDHRITDHDGGQALLA
jgi:anti-anti-sigma factor